MSSIEKAALATKLLAIISADADGDTYAIEAVIAYLEAEKKETQQKAAALLAIEKVIIGLIDKVDTIDAKDLITILRAMEQTQGPGVIIKEL